MNEATSATKDPICGMTVDPATVTPDSVWRLTAVRSSLVGLAFSLAMSFPIRVLYAQPAHGDHGDAEGMMGHSNGWMGGWAGGGMWLWTLIGVLVVVLLVVVIPKVSRK